MRTLVAALTALMLFAMPVVAENWEDAAAALDAGDYQKAFQLFKPLAEQGVARAQNNLGLMYANGEGDLEDYVQAYAWWSIAATWGMKMPRRTKASSGNDDPRADRQGQKLAAKYWRKYVVPFQKS